MGECAERKVKNEGKGLSEGLRKGVYRRGGGDEPEKMDGGGRPIKGAPEPGEERRRFERRQPAARGAQGRDREAS